MERGLHASLKPKRKKSYASLDSNGGKPCPTCYAPMTELPDGVTEKGNYWTCLRHGRPSKP